MSYKKILFRRDTAANWTTSNPTLSAGEIGLETDGNKIKLGNGSTAWNSLPYFYGTVQGVSLDDIGDVTITSASSGQFLKWNGTAWVNDSVDLGTDTTGSYMLNVAGGTGVTISHTPGEGSTASVSIGQDVGTSASVTFAQVTISGDLTVNGTTTTLNTEQLAIEDNIVLLNSNATGAPVANAGIEVERGSSANVQLRWNEGSDKWELTVDGTNYADIATETYAQSLTPNSIDEIGDVNIVSASTGDFLKWDGSAWVNDAINLGSDTVGNYMSGVTAGTGVNIIHTPGEGSNATIAIGQDVGTTASVSFLVVELGHASDTTLARGAAGRLTVEGVNVPTISSTDTLTNKTITLGSNTVTGTKSQFDTAVTDDNFAYTGTANAFTANQTVTGTVTAQAASTQDAVVLQGRAGGTSSRSVTLTPASLTASRTLTLPDATTTVVGTDSTQTLTNKTINFGSNTVTGTLSQFNTAVTDADLVSIAGTETLTNKTLTSPQINSGTASAMTLTGSLTAGGATGTSGQFLQSTGSGVQWAAASPSASTTTVSVSSSTEIYSFNPSTHGAADLLITATQGSKKTLMKTLVGHDGSSSATNVNTSKIEYGSPVIPLTISADWAASPPDLTTWVTRTSSFNHSINTVKYANGIWVAGGRNTSFNGQISTSTDAITWTTQVSNFGGGGAYVQDVAYGNGVWVGVSSSNGQLRSSTDAVTWTTQTSTFGSGEIHAVEFGDGQFIAGGTNGQMRASTDGTTWTTVTSQFGTDRINTIKYANGIWVAGGENNTLRTSTDGVTWVTRTTNFVYFGYPVGINSVAYGNNVWVGVSTSGQLRTSTDTITWVTRSLAGSSDIKTVGFDGTSFLTGNAAGVMLSSTDGTTWTTRTSTFGSTSINEVTYGNGLWVAVGDNGQMRTNAGSNKVSVTATITDANSISATVKVLPTLIEV